MGKSGVRRKGGTPSHTPSPKKFKPAKFQEIFDAMKAYKDDGGDHISQPFNRLPPKRNNPDYYKIVENPIDLSTIQRKIRSEEYAEFEGFQKDVELLVDNAKTYYDCGDKEYIDGCALWAVFKKTLAKMANQSSSSEDSEESPEDSEDDDDDEIPIPRPASRKSVGTPKTKPKKETPSKRKTSNKLKQPIKSDPGKADENDLVIGDNDDPFSMFFDNIVLLTDSDGDPISGPFLQLPSKKMYPDYFDDIKQPIALDKIRQKVMKGRYKTLAQMEDDIALMCNNAREFNVEGSQIYMDATLIMRFARSKRVDIESQFPDIPEETERVEKLEKPKKPRQRRSNTGDSEDKSKGNRLQRSVYNAMFSMKDPSGRQVCTIFMLKPDPDVYPDYYQVIKEPMDMGTIDGKISNSEYSSLEELMRDISCMCKNAKQYNEPNSQVFIDANVLEQVAQKKVTEICQKKNIPVTPEKVGLNTDPKNPPTWRAGPKTKYDFIIDRVKKQEDGMGRNLAHMFQQLPSKVELPDYYRLIKRPMDIDKIEARVKKIPEENGYKNIEEFMEEILLCFENATIYNEPGSTIYQDALILHKVAIDCLHVVENGTPQDPNPAFKIQDPQSFLQGMMRDLQNFMSSDFDFKRVEEVLSDFIPTERNRPRKLVDIEVWLDAKRYRRLDVYQGHVFSLFEAIRERCEPGDEVWKLCLELHKKFIKKRDELTKNGQIYSSPACAYGEGDIEDCLDDLKKRREEGEFTPSNGETWDVDSMLVMFDVETEDIETEINLGNDNATYYLQVHLPNPPPPMAPILYKVDDCVYLSVNDTRGPRIARIQRIWKDTQGNYMFQGFLYLRPEETSHEPVRNFHFKELIQSHQEQIFPLHTVRGRCCVLVKPDFQAMRPVNIQENHVYVHESNYREIIDNTTTKLMVKKMRSFKRYAPSNRVVDDEYLYFGENKTIPLLPTPSPRLDSMVKQEIRKRTFEAQQINGGQPPPPTGPTTGLMVRPGFPPQMRPMHPGSPYHPGSPVPPPYMHRMPMPHLQRPPMTHSPHPYAPSPGQSYTSVSSPAPIQRAPFTPQMPPQSAETPKTGKRGRVSTKGTGLSTTGYTLYTAAVNKQCRDENPSASFGELSRIIGEKWRTLKLDEKKEFEDKAKIKVAEAQKKMELNKLEEKRRREMELIDTDSMGSDSNCGSQVFHHTLPQSPGQANVPPQQFVATNPIPQSQIPNPVHQVQRIVQSPMKPGNPNGVAPGAKAPPNARPKEIQSRATGPLVTNPPKPTRILHSEAYLRYMEGLDNGKPPESKWDRIIANVHPHRAEQMNLPVHWLRNQGAHKSLKQALVHIKDVLLRDAINPQHSNID